MEIAGGLIDLRRRLSGKSRRGHVAAPAHARAEPGRPNESARHDNGHCRHLQPEQSDSERCRRHFRTGMHGRNHLAQRPDSDKPSLRIRRHPAAQLGGTRLPDRRILGEKLSGGASYSGTDFQVCGAHRRRDRIGRQRHRKGKSDRSRIVRKQIPERTGRQRA